MVAKRFAFTFTISKFEDIPRIIKYFHTMIILIRDMLPIVLSTVAPYGLYSSILLPVPFYFLSHRHSPQDISFSYCQHCLICFSLSLQTCLICSIPQTSSYFYLYRLFPKGDNQYIKRHKPTHHF